MWMGDLSGYSRTWSKQEIVKISAHLTRCNGTRPFDIHRSIRTLNQISYWKGTEFRTFLLYLGIVVLKNHLTQREYEMFLNLYCAVTICSTKAYQPYLPLARDLFIDFIEDHIDIHGEISITMNIHNTSHVVDDVETFGPLDTISAYPFENALHHLKLKLKQCNYPLQQIARRILESVSSLKVAALKPDNFSPKVDHAFTNSEHNLAFKQVKYKPNSIISSHTANGKDKWFLTHDNAIVKFQFVVKRNDKFIICGSTVKNTQNFFQKPFDSKNLNIFLSDGEVNAAESHYFELTTIKAKMFCLPYEKQWVFVPLLHSL